MAKIKCEVCGSLQHVIKNHLREEHGEGSKTPMTLEQYQAKFPNAPLYSDDMKAAMKAKKSEAEKPAVKVAAAAVKTGATEGTYATAYFDELYGFNVKTTPEALSAKGDRIRVKVDQRVGREEEIPDAEEIYPDVEMVKNLTIALDFGFPINIWGAPGLGKTSIVRFVCHKTRRRMVRVQHSASLEMSHVVGEKTVRKETDDKGVTHTFIDYELGPLALAMMHGDVYLADEYDRAPPEVNSIYQAILEGQPLYIPDAPPEMRKIYPAEGFAFVATGNTNGTGDETGNHIACQLQDAANYERFVITEEAKHLPRDIEKNILVKKANLPEEYADQLLNFADKIRAKYPTEISQTIGPRVLLNIAKIGSIRASFIKGVELAYAARLRSVEKQSVMEIANKMLA